MVVVTNRGPLDGVRVIELGGIGPGPHAAMVLADLGADVVRVRRPGGLTMPAEDRDLLHRGKRIVDLDVKTQPEALLNIHVLNEADELVGVVSVIGLLQSAPDTPVLEVSDLEPVRVTPAADVTDIALLMADYNLVTIPVVDERDHVLGVVTFDDLLEATVPEDWRRPMGRPEASQ